jgi:hypothetical protein
MGGMKRFGHGEVRAHGISRNSYCNTTAPPLHDTYIGELAVRHEVTAKCGELRIQIVEAKRIMQPEDLFAHELGMCIHESREMKSDNESSLLKVEQRFDGWLKV